MQPRLRQSISASGGDDTVSAMHGRACEQGDAGTVQEVSDAEGTGQGFAGGAGEGDSVHGVFSEQGEELARDGRGAGGGTWREGAVIDGETNASAGGGSEDGECGAGEC